MVFAYETRCNVMKTISDQLCGDLCGCTCQLEENTVFSKSLYEADGLPLSVVDGNP